MKWSGQTEQHTGYRRVLDACVFWGLSRRVTLIFLWLFLWRVVARTLDLGRRPVLPSLTHTHSQTPVTPCGTWCACSRGLQWLRLQEITQLLITLSYNVSAGAICKHQTPLMKHSSLNPHLSISNTITQHALCAELNPQTRRQSWHKKQQVIIQISIQNSAWNIQKYHNKSTTGRWTLTELTRNDSSSDFMITATVRLITWSWK